MYFTKPETALKQARDLEDVGRPQLALEALYDLITSRKHRTWSRVHEEIMFKFVELSLQLKESQMIKDGLHQYKNICQQVAVPSLEKVVRYYLRTAEDRVKSAKGQLDKVILDIDDLEEVETPESVLLAAVSEEDAKDRSERDLLTPWLKYLWDAYRTVLDILRNNSKVERLYQETTMSAFQFCVRFDRKKEFRNMCDTLRKHFQMIGKWANQTNPISLNNPESLQIHIEVRLSQISAASRMELWQEAFKAAEDISTLMAASKKRPRPQMLAVFYEHLANVLWKSGDFVVHAAIWQQQFQLFKEHKKNFTPDEAQRLASEVLLSALSVPIVVQAEETSDVLEASEKARYLASLANIASVPTRDEIVRDLKTLNILQYVNPELKEAYHWLEEEFHPLLLSQRMNTIFEWLKSQERLKQYVAPLRQVAMMRLMKQLSQIYQSIKMSRIVELVPFATEFEIERFVVQAVKDRIIQARLSHRERAIFFGTNVFASQAEDNSDGPQMQSLQSQMMRRQLTTLAQRLSVAAEMIDPEQAARNRERHRRVVFELARSKLDKEHQQLLARRDLIEARKEYLEKETLIKEKEELETQAKERDERARQEAERIADESRKREAQREAKDMQERRKDQALTKIEELKKKGGHGALANLKTEDLRGLDAEAIEQKRTEQLDRESKEHAAKVRALEKKLDFEERAKRLEETPLLQAFKQKLEDKQRDAWLQRARAREDKQREDHAKRWELKQRLEHIQPKFEAFVAQIRAARQSEFAQAKSAYDAAVEKQIQAEKAAAAAAELARIEKERIEAEQREAKKRADEEARAARAAEEAQKRAAEEERRQKQEEQRQKQDEIARKQREREQEIEAKLKARTEQPPPARVESQAWRPAARTDAPDAGSWRAKGEESSSGAYRAPQPRGDGPYRPPTRDDGPRRDDGPYRPPTRDDGPRRDDGPYRPPARDGPPRRDDPRDGPRPSAGAYRPPGSRPDTGKW